MDYERYAALKKDLEVYFAEIIMKRFRNYVEEHTELHFAADFLSHELISDLLSVDGFSVYGMNVNMDGFEVLLDFHHDYMAIQNFLFTRVSVDFRNDGNYTVYLSEKSFNTDWSVHFHDEFARYTRISETEFQRLLDDVKNIHIKRVLKMSR
jgi:hypothetical protein